MKEDDLQVENLLGMKFRERNVCLGGEQAEISRERSRRIDLKSRGTYIQEFYKPRSIESYRGLKTRLLAIEDLMKGFLNKEARWIEVAIEQVSRGQKVSRWIKLAIESYRECDKNQLKGLDRQLICRELSILLKNSFSKKRKTQI